MRNALGGKKKTPLHLDGKGNTPHNYVTDISWLQLWEEKKKKKKHLEIPILPKYQMPSRAVAEKPLFKRHSFHWILFPCQLQQIVQALIVQTQGLVPSDWCWFGLIDQKDSQGKIRSAWLAIQLSWSGFC